MTPKHRDRINALLESLDDYKYNASFDRTDIQIHELNAIYALERRLKIRLQEPVDEDLG